MKLELGKGEGGIGGVGGERGIGEDRVLPVSPTNNSRINVSKEELSSDDVKGIIESSLGSS